jgi:hypothetical protein
MGALPIDSAEAAFIPFGGYISRNITYVEQQILVASIVHRYDFQLAEPGVAPRHNEALTCSPGSIPSACISRNQRRKLSKAGIQGS